MYSLIRDFIAAVTDHRQVWCIDARRATEETMLAYERCYQEAKARMPTGYRHIRPDPDTGRPGVLFARSFTGLVMSLSLDTALWFQRRQRTFLSRICDLIRDYDESMPSSFDEFYEPWGGMGRGVD
ncbi:hypothetical protein PCG10_007377 [Penicillium crustosum]|uniref:Uncharacterized protein n=1 Tax=Penicillium crustosum TaxID=36656 RepID=A0A9P5GMS5_PENCR|nr:uncharacterized protein N7487_012179 [Penicillium crustosum]KAF7522462.1 hypothetical protein PCG10_007377 [Penicillium crustosum]KAJ5394538.1 hypothetical protein N7487_012179 [Penicillium crustosum]